MNQNEIMFRLAYLNTLSTNDRCRIKQGSENYNRLQNKIPYSVKVKCVVQKDKYVCMPDKNRANISCIFSPCLIYVEHGSLSPLSCPYDVSDKICKWIQIN